MKAYSPDGALIVGTLEVLYGFCGVYDDSFERVEPGGGIGFEHDGLGTNIYWDASETLKRDGKMVFIDENHREWTEDQLVLVEKPDEPIHTTEEPTIDDWRQKVANGDTLLGFEAWAMSKALEQ